MRIQILTFLLVFVWADDRPIVRTKNGLIRGVYRESRLGRNFAAFEGIPYAKPPINHLRFKDPQPKDSWTDIWDANNVTKCLQLAHSVDDIIDLRGTEDCLYLNVYSPRLKTENEKLLDVLFYIHGGAFMFGIGAVFGAKNLIDRDVVFVNFNYRLGPLGFLSTEDDALPGNIGLKDQVMALKWVKDNIEHFGGNPASVTIVGMSCGGSSVHFHYLSPLSRGLFKQGISMSGTALTNWALVENPLEKAQKLGKIVGCDKETTKDLVECLREKPGDDIVKAVKKFQPWLYNPFTTFGPVIEPKGQLGTRFLDEHPYKLLKQGQVLDAPWITTVVSHEGLYPGADFYSDEKLNHLNKNWQVLSPYILHYDGTVLKNQQSEVAEKIANHYWSNQSISLDTFSELIQAIGDRLFVTDSQKAARLQAQINKSPVYFYRFSYRGGHSLAGHFVDNSLNLGVSHTDDEFYAIFYNGTFFQSYLETEDDKKMSEIMLNMWSSYASTGIPKMGNIQWEPVSKEPDSKFIHLHVNSPHNITIERPNYLGHFPFWESLPFLENDKLNL